MDENAKFQQFQKFRINGEHHESNQSRWSLHHHQNRLPVRHCKTSTTTQRWDDSKCDNNLHVELALYAQDPTFFSIILERTIQLFLPYCSRPINKEVSIVIVIIVWIFFYYLCCVGMYCGRKKLESLDHYLFNAINFRSMTWFSTTYFIAVTLIASISC